MQAFLVRIGVDQSFGGRSAPVDPRTREFVYSPIPETAKTFHPQCRLELGESHPSVNRFYQLRGMKSPEWPTTLMPSSPALEPESANLNDDPFARRVGFVCDLLRGLDRKGDT